MALTSSLYRYVDDLGYFLPLHFLFTKLPNVYYRPTILTKEKGGNYEQTMRRRRGVRQNWLKRQRVYYIDRRTNKPSWLSFSHLIMIVLPLSSPFTLHFLTDFCCTVLCFCVYLCMYSVHIKRTSVVWKERKFILLLLLTT